MKTVHVAAAVLCDSVSAPTRIYATARGYGDYKGQWEFPGGKLEPGETAAEAVVREIREELRLEISAGPLLGTIEYDYPAFHLKMDCFLCEILSGTPVLTEAADARWLTKASLESVRWLPADETVLPALRDAMREPCRCRWANPKNPVYLRYHDEEWGVPLHGDRALYELFILETFQAGLSWECVLNKREHFREAYEGFDIDRVCEFDEAKLAALQQDPGIIRNRSKLAASVENSRIIRALQREFGSFDAYLRSFTGDAVIYECDPAVTVSPLSDAIAKDMKRRGMRFCGSTTIYAFLQAIGVINAHSPECWLYTGEGT